ncbi:MAG: RdgB/HAM1 family non-canonical purine NTP pyrophosphatase, partial [Verrucomicrobiota bacterium]|nr:RdgB/HAM1 family non-canonical purine NTP pyrophosphatase [Verrucomicrobiota bacterium]
MHSLLLATRNEHKTREFAAILGSGFDVGDLSAVLHLPPVEETGRTFAENAVLKAMAASLEGSGLVAADDSGLEVDALDNRPGIRSARYAGERATDAENVSKLLTELRCAGANRRARFQCAIALVENGLLLEVFHGTIIGRIADAPHGEGGFGYDPIFIPDGYEQTFAALGEELKNRISHRGRAIAQLRKYLVARS